MTKVAPTPLYLPLCLLIDFLPALKRDDFSLPEAEDQQDRDDNSVITNHTT